MHGREVLREAHTGWVRRHQGAEPPAHGLEYVGKQRQWVGGVEREHLVHGVLHVDLVRRCPSDKRAARSSFTLQRDHTRRSGLERGRDLQRVEN